MNSSWGEIYSRAFSLISASFSVILALDGDVAMFASRIGEEYMTISPTGFRANRLLNSNFFRPKGSSLRTQAELKPGLHQSWLSPPSHDGGQADVSWRSGKKREKPQPSTEDILTVSGGEVCQEGGIRVPDRMTNLSALQAQVRDLQASQVSACCIFHRKALPSFREECHRPASVKRR